MLNILRLILISHLCNLAVFPSQLIGLSLHSIFLALPHGNSMMFQEIKGDIRASDVFLL